MRRKWRFRYKLWWLRLLHVLPAALLGLLLFYWVVTSSWFLCYAVLPRLSQITGMPLKARSVNLELWQGRLTLSDFSAGKEDAGIFFCRGRTLSLSFRYRGLWDGIIALDDIAAAGTEVRITIPVGEPHPPASAKTSPTPLQVQLSRLTASDSRLQLIWEHQLSGQRFDLRVRDIDATMDQLQNGGVSTLKFTCQPDYEDGLLDLTARRAHGDWQLAFNQRLHLTGSDWITRLEDGAGRFGRFDWPVSTAASRIQFRNGSWNFVELRGRGSTPETVDSSFDVAGALSGKGFDITPGSTLNLNALLLRQWFGEAYGTMGLDLTLEGTGSYRHPGGRVQFSWRHQGALNWAENRLELPPFRAAGAFRLALDRDRNRLTLADTAIHVTPADATDAIRLQIPAEHPVTYDWNTRVFTDTAGQIRLSLQQLPITLLTQLFPLPSGWKPIAGAASGELALETLAAGTPQLGATGEIAIDGLNLSTPAGPGEAGDLYLDFELSSAEEQWRLPRWQLSYRRAGQELLQLTGEADWNLQSRAIDFRLTAPLVSSGLLPRPYREQLEAWLQRLHIQELQGALQGQFRPGLLRLQQLELHSSHWHLALQPQEFTAGNAWSATRWRLTATDWPLTASSALSGSADVEWQPQQFSWEAAWKLDGLEWDSRHIGALAGTFAGSWHTGTRQLDVRKLTWEGPEAGSGSVLPFACEWESHRLLKPLQLNWRDLKPQLLLPQWHGGLLAGKAVLLQEPDRWHTAITLESTAPFFTPPEWKFPWPLMPSAHIQLEWPFGSPELEVQGSWEQNTSPDEPTYNLHTAMRWNPVTGSGSAEVDILTLRLPQTPWRLHNSELQLRFRPRHLELEGKLWGAISDYLQGSAEVRLTATPEAVSVEKCNGQITTQSAEPALVWDASMRWGWTAPEQTDMTVRIKKWQQPLLQRPGELDPSDDAAAPAGEAAAPWQFDFGPRQWECRFQLDDFTPVAGISGKGAGVWRGHADAFEFQTSHLNCNGAELQIGGSLHNRPGDYPQFTLQLQGSDLDTAAWWQSLYHSRSTNAGIIRRIEVDLAGSAAPPPRFWDDLVGYTEARIETVDIENQFQQTTIGKLLFLPLEAYLRVRAILPGGSGGWIPQVGSLDREFLSLFHNTRRFTFERGTVRLVGADGVISVEQFDLYGTDIDHLQFSGTVGCGSNRQLDLNSTIDFQGLIVPLQLEGTLENPQIEWDETTLRLFSDNAVSWGSRLLNTGVELLSTGTRLFSSGK